MKILVTWVKLSFFFTGTEKAQTTKQKINTLDLKIRNLCSSKNTVEKIKVQVTGWEKTFAKHILNKGLVSRIQNCYNLIKRQKFS